MVLIILNQLHGYSVVCNTLLLLFLKKFHLLCFSFCFFFSPHLCYIVFLSTVFCPHITYFFFSFCKLPLPSFLLLSFPFLFSSLLFHPLFAAPTCGSLLILSFLNVFPFLFLPPSLLHSIGGSIPIVFSYYSEFLAQEKRGEHLSWLCMFWMIGGIYASAMAWAIIPHYGEKNKSITVRKSLSKAM